MVEAEEARYRTPLVDAMLARRSDSLLLFLPFVVIAVYALVLAYHGSRGIVIVVMAMGLLTLVTGLVFWWLIKQLSIDTEYSQEAFGSDLEAALPYVEEALAKPAFPSGRCPCGPTSSRAVTRMRGPGSARWVGRASWWTPIRRCFLTSTEGTRCWT